MRRSNPLVVWLAVVLVLFLALAPTVVRATASSRVDAVALLDICTGNRVLPQGFDAASVPGVSEQPEGDVAVVHVSHCPFCRLASETDLPPPAQVIALVVAQPPDLPRPPERQALPTPPDFMAATPRGPPQWR
ncbi:MAG: DUF2946 family protein [Rhodoferax sp.]|nr:DUF2946 family protein [Rhodoferax sp.]